jgi:TPR repeat protein
MIWAVLFLAVTVQLPAQQPTTNAVGTNISDWVAVSPSDTNTATMLFEEIKAKAEKGDPEAQFRLGELFSHGLIEVDGKFVKQVKNKKEAIKWFSKAAEQNYQLASLQLGELFLKDKEYSEAMKWLRKAADFGYLMAMETLGEMYQNGLGVAKDYEAAVHWYRMAAEQGEFSSQHSLGMMYERGDGVAKDYVEAYKWYNIAIANPDYQKEQAMLREESNDTFHIYDGEIGQIERDLNALESRMTPEQIAEAQRLSRDFKPGKESSSDNSTSSDNPTATGTGFFITDDGYLITNYHVVKGAAKVRLLTGAGLIDASVVKVDAANDLALLKANAEGSMQNAETFKPLPITASRTVKLGGTVATVGFPDIGLQGFAPKLAKGEIASLAGAGDDPRYFQISLPVQPGNSGGALVDARGNVVGIVAAKLDASAALAATGSLPENVNYAVKSSLLLSFLESVPDVDAKLKEPNTKDESFEDVVKSAQDAAILVLVY